MDNELVISRATGSIVLVLAVAALLPSSSSAWHYKFQDFFDFEDGSIAAAVAKAEKCGPGGKLGTYDYRSFVLASGGDTEVEVEILAKLSVRDEFRKMKRVEVDARGSNVDPAIIDEIATALQDYHETVFTRWKPGKLKVRHGAMVIFGNEVVHPGESKTPFHPKPGC